MGKRKLTIAEIRAYGELARAAKRLRDAQRRALEAHTRRPPPDHAGGPAMPGSVLRPSESATVAPLLVDAATAATMLAISPRTLWQLTADGEIPVVTIGRAGKRYRPADLAAFIARAAALPRPTVAAETLARRAANRERP